MDEILKAINKLKFGELYLPATDTEIIEIEQILGIKFPRQYVEFLKITNGMLGNHFYFEQVQDLPEANEAYQIQENMPNWLRVGNDGGGSSILFNLLDKEAVPYLCEDGSLIDSEECIKQSDSLFNWLKDGVKKKYKLPFWQSPDWQPSPEFIQKEREWKHKRLLDSARKNFKDKNYKLSAELFSQAQDIKCLENKLDIKSFEYAKNHSEN